MIPETSPAASMSFLSCGQDVSFKIAREPTTIRLPVHGSILVMSRKFPVTFKHIANRKIVWLPAIFPISFPAMRSAQEPSFPSSVYRKAVTYLLQRICFGKHQEYHDNSLHYRTFAIKQPPCQQEDHQQSQQQ